MIPVPASDPDPAHGVHGQVCKSPEMPAMLHPRCGDRKNAVVVFMWCGGRVKIAEAFKSTWCAIS